MVVGMDEDRAVRFAEEKDSETGPKQVPYTVWLTEEEISLYFSNKNNESQEDEAKMKALLTQAIFNRNLLLQDMLDKATDALVTLQRVYYEDRQEIQALRRALEENNITPPTVPKTRSSSTNSGKTRFFEARRNSTKAKPRKRNSLSLTGPYRKPVECNTKAPSSASGRTTTSDDKGKKTPRSPKSLSKSLSQPNLKRILLRSSDAAFPGIRTFT